MPVDAVVNAANPDLVSDGGGVCGALFHRAGEGRMRAACAALGGCPVGSAVATPGFDLPVRYVVHAVGPVWQGGGAGEEELLLACYESALNLADELGAASVALPLVSTGAFGFPVRRGLAVARRAVEDFLRDHDQEVYLVVPERRAVDIGEDLFRAIAERLGGVSPESGGTAIEAPLPGAAPQMPGEPLPRRRGPVQGEALPADALPPHIPGVEGGPALGRLALHADLSLPDAPEAAVPGQAAPCDAASVCPAAASFPAAPTPGAPEPEPSAGASHPRLATGSSTTSRVASPAPKAAPKRPGCLGRLAESMRGRLKRGVSQELTDLLGNLDASFSQTLLRLIDERGLTDAQAYRRANVSRQLFSKIRNDDGYRPSKQTVLAFAVALELTLPETRDLLERAGLALSPASASDVIVEFFIERGCYDLFLINEALFAFDQPLLGA